MSYSNLSMEAAISDALRNEIGDTFPDTLIPRILEAVHRQLPHPASSQAIVIDKDDPLYVAVAEFIWKAR